MYSLTSFDFSTHFDDKMFSVEKWDEERPVSVVYYDGEKQDWYVKRFLPEMSVKPAGFIGDHEDSKLAFATSLYHPQARVKFNRRFKHSRDKEDELVDLREFIILKGVRALGNKLSSLPVTEVVLEPVNSELEALVATEVLKARKLDVEDESEDESIEPVEEPSVPQPLEVVPEEVKPVEVKFVIKRHKASDVDEDGQGSLF